ncbi:probable glutamate receptor [Diachasma alloeum]|uniref:Ionotropic receptor 108 n=1 Tax=Diachasma alloeum TaxID=454923 RepID=A0A4E0RNM2_9HYME|nr:probable glutamate receptor [Diachasma alloeum]THK33026.1 ionotropic receptor 108 [Diachasma alloeum]
MKFFILLILLGSSSLIFVNLKEALHHGPLIKDFYDKYKSDGVWIILGSNNLLFEKTTIWHGVIKMLSKEGISTRIADFDAFKFMLKTVNENNMRPLIVLVMNAIEELWTFESIVKKFYADYTTWLILFTGDSSQDVCGFCRKPYGSLANPKFSSKVFTLCCDSEVIMEWRYSETNRSRRLEVGRLVDGNQGIVWSSDELDYNSKYSMDGRTLRVVGVRMSMLLREKNGKLSGILGELLIELSKAMNFTISKIMWEDEFGVWDAEKSNWTGAIARIHHREVDIGVSNFIMTLQRYDAVSFTTPILFGPLKFHFKKRDINYLTWNAYFKALAIDVWMATIGLILITPILLTLIRYRRRDHFFPLLLEHYSYIWGIYCQQSLPDCPKGTSLRIIYLSILISAMVTFGGYSGSMISSLTEYSGSPFNTMEDFIKDGSYKIIFLDPTLINDIYTFRDVSLRKKMMSLLKPSHSLPKNIEEAFHQVCNERVAFFLADVMKKDVVNDIPCEIYSVGTGSIGTIAMIVPLGSRYLDPVNYHLQRFKRNGLLERLKHKYFKLSQRRRSNHPLVTVEAIVPILLILAVGLLITIVIFIAERHAAHVLVTKLRDRRELKVSLRKRKSFSFPMYDYVP